MFFSYLNITHGAATFHSLMYRKSHCSYRYLLCKNRGVGIGFLTKIPSSKQLHETDAHNKKQTPSPGNPT